MKTSFDFEQIAKKSKRKHLLKTVIISSSLAVLTIGLLVKGGVEMTSKNGREIEDYYWTMSRISSPNMSFSSAYFEIDSPFNGSFVSERYKNINGISVDFTDYKGDYGLLGKNFGTFEGVVSGDNGQSAYTRSDQLKVPVFFNAKMKNSDKDAYIKPTQDIAYLSSMPGQVVEMAITFDKPYTMAEIAKLVPNELNTEFYWIGTSSDQDTSSYSFNRQIGFSMTPGLSFTAEEAKKLEKLSSEDYIKAMENAKEPSEIENINNNFTYFRADALKAIEKGWIYPSGSDDVSTDIKNFFSTYKKGEDAKYAGILLTGRTEAFAGLENQSWIYASNIGQSATVQPYHQVTK